MYNENTFKPKIKEIYPDEKKKKFGFVVDVPNETPLKKKTFKPKCKGMKKSLIYEEPEINKKYFGFLLPKLNSSLYVGKQTNHNCYETKKKKREKIFRQESYVLKITNVNQKIVVVLNF